MKKLTTTILVCFVLLALAATDWNNPSVTSTYTNVLSDLKNRDVNNARMDYAGDTNLPTGVIRWNSTSKKFESWSGSVWSDIYPEIAAHLANMSNPHSTTAAQVGAPTTATFTAHSTSTSNPHSVTASQAGALAIASNLSDLNNAATARTNLGAVSSGDLSAHTSSTSNPHSVTASQAGALAKTSNLSDVTNATTARSNISAAKSGINNDIEELQQCKEIGTVSDHLTIKPAYPKSIYLTPAGGANGYWTVSAAAQLIPPTSMRYDWTPWPSGSGGYTVRRSLNPAVATAAQCADSVNTMMADLIALGLLQ